MTILFDTINLVLFFVAAIYLFLLYLIFVKSKDRAVRNSYSIAILAIWLWTVSMILYRSSAPLGDIFWSKVLYVSATFTASSFFIFSIIFPSGRLPKIKTFLFAFLYNLLVIFLVIWPNLVIRGVQPVAGGEKIIDWGAWYFFFSFYISSLFLAGLIILFRKYRKEQGRFRSQIKLIFLGYLIGSNLAMITNMLMLSWGDFRFNWLGQVFSTIMVFFTVYAIIAHRLMDIRFVLRRYSVYSISIFLVIFLVLISKFFINELFPAFINIIDFFLLVAAILVFPFIKSRVQYLANKYFFSSLYESSKLIADISNKLRATLNINHIYDHIYHSLNSAMHIKRFGILRYDERREVFSTQYNVNFNIGRRVDFEKNDLIHKFFMEKNEPLIVSEVLATGVEPGIQETLDLLKEMKAEILLPLNIKNRVVGLIVLGAKESGDLYNSEDLQVLGIVASQSAIAIENAMLYEESKNFNIKLEKEVALATRDLREANERLKKLDQAKSEFISIASHQLRTPLTIIKGYISMMLEGSFGAISPVSREMLTKVYDSNERLVYLVENLLNISRIESGNLRFNYETIQLEKLVAGVVEELEAPAKAKNIQIEYRPLKKALPAIKVDVEKIRQVVMNLVDNALKYTSQGKVSVVLRKKDNNLFFSVTDKGMGISSDDIPHLFHKFIRGQGAMLAHTEGTGLGLYVAKQMIDAHHGRIWVESQGAGKGSKFCFELPIGGTADE